MSSAKLNHARKRFLGARQLLVFVLVTSQILQMTYSSAWAAPLRDSDDSNTGPGGIQENIKEKDDAALDDSAVFIVGELTSLREQTTKTFRLSDGSFTVADYGVPVHYTDEADEWSDIDNTLVETGRGYEPRASILDIVLPKDLSSSDGVSLSDGEHAISWKYDMVSERQAAGTVQGIAPVTAATLADLPKLTPVSLPVTGEGIPGEGSGSTGGGGTDTGDGTGTDGTGTDEPAGPDAGDGTATPDDTAPPESPAPEAEVSSLPLIQTPLAREELTGDERFTVLTSLSDKARYQAISQGVDLEYITLPNGLKENIVLHDQSAPTEYSITFSIGELRAEQTDVHTVTLIDSEGNAVWTVSAPEMTDAANTSSSEVTLTITDSSPGSVKLLVKADKGWVSSPKRVWPVMIDPVVFNVQLSQTGVFGHTYSGAAGTGFRYQIGVLYCGNEGYYYGICHMYMKLSLPSIPVSSNILSAKVGLVQVANGVDPRASTGYINAHQVLTDWGTGISPYSEPSRGSVIDYQYITNDSYYNKFVYFDITKAYSSWYTGLSPNYGLCFKADNESPEWRSTYITTYNNTPQMNPVLTVNYRNEIGLESYWTAHEQALGRSGAGYVKDMSTTLSWVHPDVAFEAGVNSIALSHVYNSNSRAYAPSTSNPGLYAGRVGAGWSLSLAQRLTPNTDSGTNADYPFIYIDADGTEHYIYGTSSNIPLDLHNKDEDGLGLTYSFANNGWGDYHHLTTKENTVLIFDVSGNLVKVRDSNNNVTTLTWATLVNNKPGGGDNYLVSISTPAGTVVLGWSDYVEGGSTLKRLDTVTDPAGRVTSYTYSGDQLIRITYPDGTYTSFGYAGYALALVTGTDGFKISYTLTASASYTSAREATSTGTLGNGYTIARSGYLQTTYTDIKTPSHYEVYQFSVLIILKGSQ